MKTFTEAVKALEQGKKITRDEWKDTLYFVKKNAGVYAFQKLIVRFEYTETILLSKDWYIEGHEKTFSFPEIIPFLEKGERVYISKDGVRYIYLDMTTGDLICYIEELLSYIPRFSDFITNDWIILHD